MKPSTLTLLGLLSLSALAAMAADAPPRPTSQQLAWQRHEFIAVRLKEFGAFVAQLYATDFVPAATVSASSRRDPSHHERNVQDRELYTSWTPAEDRTTGQIEFDLGQARTFNMARIQEDKS